MLQVILLFLLVTTSLCQANNQAQYAHTQAVKKTANLYDLKRPKVLFNIDPSNSHLEVVCKSSWSCAGGIKNWGVKGNFKKGVRVKVVSWVSESTAAKYFSPLAGKDKYYNTGKRHLWVTAFPQVKLFCQKRDSQNIGLRLEQYLGLSPTGLKTHFVNIWVKPENLFRPCFDPEIFDTKCDYGPSEKTSTKHLKWMADSSKSSYGKTPWTRLGYTFDWGKTKSHFGAAEYVINFYSNIYIESVTPTEIYCAK